MSSLLLRLLTTNKKRSRRSTIFRERSIIQHVYNQRRGKINQFNGQRSTANVANALQIRILDLALPTALIEPDPLFRNQFILSRIVSYASVQVQYSGTEGFSRRRTCPCCGGCCGNCVSLINPRDDCGWSRAASGRD